MQARKLGLKPGQRVSLDDPPPGWTLSDPPDGLLYVGGPGEAPSEPDEINAMEIVNIEPAAAHARGE